MVMTVTNKRREYMLDMSVFPLYTSQSRVVIARKRIELVSSTPANDRCYRGIMPNKETPMPC